MTTADREKIQALIAEKGVFGLLENIAEYCDEMADIVKDTSTAQERDLRKWSKRIWRILEE